LASRNIYCIGRNYLSHINELGNERPSEPVLFLKSGSALRDLSADNKRDFPYPGEAFDHELEIVCEIGQAIPLNSKANWSQVNGIRLGLDLTRRGKQTELKSKSLPWTLAKSFAGSAVVAELVPTSRILNLGSIQFELKINGETRQTGDSAMMIWQPLELLSFISQSHDLVPGDLIFTGTPSGVGPIRYGDQVEMSLLREKMNFTGKL
jgi:acylpyruvate hydrolase